MNHFVCSCIPAGTLKLACDRAIEQSTEQSNTSEDTNMAPPGQIADDIMYNTDMYPEASADFYGYDDDFDYERPVYQPRRRNPPWHQSQPQPQQQTQPQTWLLYTPPPPSLPPHPPLPINRSRKRRRGADASLPDACTNTASYCNLCKRQFNNAKATVRTAPAVYTTSWRSCGLEEALQ